MPRSASQFVAGRDFDERDSSRVPEVAIINETFARRHFPGEDPIGRTLVTGMAQRAVPDRRHRRRHPQQHVERAAGSGLFPAVPAAAGGLHQRPRAHERLGGGNGTGGARRACEPIDPDLPLLQPQPLTARMARTVADRKLALMLLGGFAVLALVLASLGVYSVMAHLVAFRTSEIGLRMALGASPGAVMRMVLGHGRRLTLARNRARYRRRASCVAADAPVTVRSRSS